MENDKNLKSFKLNDDDLDQVIGGQTLLYSGGAFEKSDLMMNGSVNSQKSDLLQRNVLEGNVELNDKLKNKLSGYNGYMSC